MLSLGPGKPASIVVQRHACYARRTSNPSTAYAPCLRAPDDPPCGGVMDFGILGIICPIETMVLGSWRRRLLLSIMIAKFTPGDPCIWIEDETQVPEGTPVRQTPFRPFYGHGSLQRKFKTDIFLHFDGTLLDEDQQDVLIVDALEETTPAVVVSANRKDGVAGRCALMVFPEDVPAAITYVTSNNKPSGVHF